MKRHLLPGLFLIALGFSAPASETLSQLKPFGRGSWHDILRSHAGHPTIVHFWGVTCGPCKVELPLLGAFMRDHAAIDVVTISADLVPDLPDATRSMLAKAGLASAENWIFGDGFVERLRYEIDPAWQGDIPRTMLISRDGTITTIEGSAEIADLEKWSDRQLAAAGSADPGETGDIAGLLHGMFDKPGVTLNVSPVVVAGDHAIADWSQGEMGGRALLRRKQRQWSLIICAGDGIKSRDALAKAGVPADDAVRLEQQLASAESRLASAEVAMFSKFEGLVMMDGPPNEPHGHSEHRK